MPYPNYLLEDPPLVPLDEAEERRRLGLLPVPPVAPAPPMAAPTGELRRIISAPRRIDDIVNNPRLADYEKAMAVEAEVKAGRPQPEKPKWWQQLAAGAAGGLAGYVNASGRTRVDPTSAVEGIYGVPEQRRKLADWMSRVEGAEAKSQATKGSLDEWRAKETLDRQNRLADSQIEENEAQAEARRAAAGKPVKPDTQLIGSTLYERAPSGEWQKVAEGPEADKVVAPGGSVVRGGKAIFTSPAKPAAETQNRANWIATMNDPQATAEATAAAKANLDEDDKRIKANRPPRASAVAGGDDALVNAVIANPLAFDNLTPTAKTRIIPKLQAAGFENFGKPASEGAMSKMAETKSAVASLQDLRQTLLDNEQYIGPIAGFQALNPYSEARKAQAKIDLVKQRVGKALEGGVLRKEDEDKYKRILATLRDEPSTAIAKVDGLIATLERDAAIFREEQRAGGRRVGEAAPKGKAEAPKASGGTVRVRRKSDGQTGTIDSKDFDAAKYEKL